MRKIGLFIIVLLGGSSLAGCSTSQWVEVPHAMYQQTVTYFAPPDYPEPTTRITDDAAAFF